MRAALPLLAALLFTTAASRAQQADLVAGWEGGASRGYGFVQPSVSVGLAPGLAAFGQATASHLRYDLAEGTGRSRVASPGVGMGAGLRFARPRVTASAGVGYETRWTRRGLADGTEAEERESGALVQGNVFARPAPRTTVSALASYGAANRYVWTRAGVLQQVLAPQRGMLFGVGVGAEVTAQGNDDARGIGAGGVLDLGLRPFGGSLQFRAGYAQTTFSDDSGEGKVYVGFGVYRAL